MGGWDPHLSEENSIESVSIVLPGVNENGLDLGMTLHLAHQGGDLGQVRARSHDVHDFETAVHGSGFNSCTRSPGLPAPHACCHPLPLRCRSSSGLALLVAGEVRS